jgi:hypothetical protein
VVGDVVVGATVVRAGIEGAGAAVFVVDGAIFLGAVVIGVIDVGARVVGAGVEGAGMAVVGGDGANVIEAGVVVDGARWS